VQRPSFPTFLLTCVVLAFLLAPALLLHGEALAALAAHPELWKKVSPLTPSALALLWRSLALCAGVFVATLVIGVPVGFGLARGPRVWQMFAGPLCAVAVAIPPALAAAPFVAISVSAGVPEDGSIGTYLLSVLALAGCYFPLVAGATLVALRALPAEEEEAALLLTDEAPAWRGVLRGRVAPAALAGAFGAAALALWEMGAPDLLGWPTFSMHVYRNLAATDASAEGLFQLRAPLAAAITGVPVLLLGFLLLWPAARLLRSVELRANTGSGVGRNAPSKLANLLVIPASVALAIFPVMLMVDFVRKVGAPGQTWKESAQLGWLAVKANSDSILNTVYLPGAAAILLPLLAFALAAGWREWPLKWRRNALIACLAPILVTPVVLAVALVEAWNQDWLSPVYDSPYGMTLIGYGARFLPLTIALAVWSVQSVDEELLRAARGLGASAPRVALTILAPLLRVSIVGLAALVFSLCAGELTVTVLVQAPGGSTLPLPIFSLLHAGLSGDVAALSLLQCVLSGSAMVVAGAFLGRRK